MHQNVAVWTVIMLWTLFNGENLTDPEREISQRLLQSWLELSKVLSRSIHRVPPLFSSQHPTKCKASKSGTRTAW